MRSVYGWKGLGELLKPIRLLDRSGEFLVKSLVTDDADAVVFCSEGLLPTVLLMAVDEGGSGARLFLGELTCSGAGVVVVLGGCHRGFFSSSFLPSRRQGITDIRVHISQVTVSKKSTALLELKRIKGS